MKARNYLWTGRILVVIAVISGLFWSPTQLALCTVAAIAALFYATAGIINAIEQARAGAHPEKRAE